MQRSRLLTEYDKSVSSHSAAASGLFSFAACQMWQLGHWPESVFWDGTLQHEQWKYSFQETFFHVVLMSKLSEHVGFRHDKWVIKLSDRKSFADLSKHLDRNPTQPTAEAENTPTRKTSFQKSFYLKRLQCLVNW